MLRIVIFDGGWGGQVVANYLASELQVTEVTSVIDWEHAPYEDKSPSEICHFAEQCLEKYFGKVDLIVLGGYAVSLATDYLRKKYQNQKIVNVDINFYQILRSRFYPDRITLLMNSNLMRTKLYTNLREQLPYSTIAIPDCSGWEKLANAGELTSNVMRLELGSYFQLRKAKDKPVRKTKTRQTILETINQNKDDVKQQTKPNDKPVEVWPEEKLLGSDLVLLLNTHLWDLKEAVESVFGYGVRVLDFREKLLHDVCIALELLGVDGKRSH